MDELVMDGADDGWGHGGLDAGYRVPTYLHARCNWTLRFLNFPLPSPMTKQVYVLPISRAAVLLNLLPSQPDPGQLTVPVRLALNIIIRSWYTTTELPPRCGSHLRSALP